MKLPSLIKLASSDPHYKAEWITFLQGRYQSPWNFLVAAARSNLIHAADETKRLIQIYRRATERGQRSAETLFIMDLNYSTRLAGPLIGSILSSSAALETFFRLAMRAFVERDLSKRRRVRRMSNEALKKLAEFDKFYAVAKIDYLYKTILRYQCQATVMKEYKHLVDFRNRSFHSDPAVFLGESGYGITKGGYQFKLRRSRGEPPEYPLHWESNRPLSLSFALRAVRLHDVIVQELLDGRAQEYLHEALEFSQLSLIQGLLPKWMKPETLDLLALVWDGEIETELRKVSEGDRRNFLIELERQQIIHSVK